MTDKTVTIKFSDLEALVNLVTMDNGFCKDKESCDCAHCVAIRLLGNEAQLEQPLPPLPRKYRYGSGTL